jgi:hypothetical protein
MRRRERGTAIPDGCLEGGFFCVFLSGGCSRSRLSYKWATCRRCVDHGQPTPCSTRHVRVGCGGSGQRRCLVFSRDASNPCRTSKRPILAVSRSCWWGGLAVGHCFCDPSAHIKRVRPPPGPAVSFAVSAPSRRTTSPVKGEKEADHGALADDISPARSRGQPPSPPSARLRAALTMGAALAHAPAGGWGGCARASSGGGLWRRLSPDPYRDPRGSLNVVVLP